MVIEAFLQCFPLFGFKLVLVAVLNFLSGGTIMTLIIKRKAKRYRIISHGYAAKMVFGFFGCLFWFFF